jgi:hypothetical protein
LSVDLVCPGDFAAPETTSEVAHSQALSEPYFTADVLANDSDSDPTVDIRTVLSFGQTIETSPGKEEIIGAFGSPGTTLGGMFRVQAASKHRTWILLNRDNLSELLRPGDELAGMPGTSIKSIEEPAGRAVLVKFASEEVPRKLHRALL